MTRTVPVVAVCAPLVAALWAAGTVATAQSSAGVFQGLTHAQIGSGILHLDASRDALEVSNLGSAGADGVAVDLGGNAKRWTARMDVAGLHSIPFNMTLDAIADGQRISTQSIRQVGGRFSLTAAFTGVTKPTYSAQVYNDGHLVEAVGNLAPTALLYIPISFCFVFPDIFDCGFTIEFWNDVDNTCGFKNLFKQVVDIELPNGVVAKGNELRLVEEVRPGGRYLYPEFHAMAVRSNAHLLTLLKETVQ